MKLKATKEALIAIIADAQHARSRRVFDAWTEVSRLRSQCLSVEDGMKDMSDLDMIAAFRVQAERLEKLSALMRQAEKLEALEDEATMLLRKVCD